MFPQALQPLVSLNYFYVASYFFCLLWLYLGHGRAVAYQPGVLLEERPEINVSPASLMNLSDSDEISPVEDHPRPHSQNLPSDVYGTPISGASFPLHSSAHPNYTPGYTPISRRRHATRTTQVNDEIRDLLQQQQAMIQHIMMAQQEKNTLFEEKFDEIERKVAAQPIADPSSSADNGKRKRLVNRDLSVS